MAIIRSDFRTSFITETLNDIFFKRINLYYFLGKVEPWPTEASPPAVSSNTLQADNEIRDNIVYIRRVTGNDVSLVTPNFEWISGQVYTKWDHTQVVQGQNFYVSTSNFDVFKCLDNAGGASSTVQPTKPINNYTVPFKTADGYTWKYMYNIPEFKRNKFLSRGYVPVQRALTDSFYSKGAIEQVVVLNQGEGYTFSPATTITSSGGTPETPATFTAVVSGGEIKRVLITNPGAGYDSAPTLTVVGTGGSGKFGNPTAILKAIVNGGEIVNVTIEDPGQNYPNGTIPTISVSGDGTGASFTPVIDQGRVIDVIVNNPGSNYTYAQLTVVQPGATVSAVLLAVLSASDFTSDQSIIEQAAVPGAIYSVNITQGGTNYTSSAQMTIAGDGTGAQGTPVVVNGSIVRVNMTSWGSGYTYATVTFSDPDRIVSPSNVEAAGYAILPPNSGHGVDAVRELYADTLCVFTLMRDDVTLNNLSQQYRQYGLLLNPIELASGRQATAETSIITFDVQLADVGTLTADTVLVNNNKRYRVVSISGNTVKLLQMNPVFSSPAGTLVDESNSAISYQISAVVSIPTINKYSGYLLCASNEPPFEPSSTQTIATRTFVKL